MRLFDCTLRDGANVVGKGFSAELTNMMLRGMISNNILEIEYGNALGLGAYEHASSIAPLTDEQYLDLAAPFMDKATIGMFMGWANARKESIEMAAKRGLSFLRVGANAGDGEKAVPAVKMVKESNLQVRYSLMKAYVLSAEDLAAESAMLEKAGVDEITIMDSAGTMSPDQVTEYVRVMVDAVSIPVGFHGHNNLELSAANAIAAYHAGAAFLDCGLMGMARSAGNLATETAVALFQRMGVDTGVNLLGLLEFLDSELAPAMKEQYGYSMPISSLDLVLGYAGCHSSYVTKLKEIASEYDVHPYQLILAVSEKDRKAPPVELMKETAAALRS